MNSVVSISPDPFIWFCPQSRLEPLLLAAARAHIDADSVSPDLFDQPLSEDNDDEYQ